MALALAHFPTLFAPGFFVSGMFWIPNSLKNYNKISVGSWVGQEQDGIANGKMQLLQYYFVSVEEFYYRQV